MDNREDQATSAPKTTLQSVERASRIFLAIAEANESPTARDLAERFGLTIPTTHNMLRTLISEGLLERDDASGYRLGPMAALVAYRVSTNPQLPAEYVQALRNVARDTGETVYLGTWRSGRIVLVDSIPSRYPVQVVASPVGHFGDDHARATGKLMLALARPDLRERIVSSLRMRKITAFTNTDRATLERELEEIRRSHVAHDDQEYVEGAHGIAVPIWVGPVASACISLHAPLNRWDTHGDEMLAIVQREAAAVSHSLPA